MPLPVQIRALFVTGLALASAAGQTPSVAIPPIRPLGPIIRVGRDTLAYVSSIRVLSDGRVLANDTQARRIVLFDSSLAHPLTVADTTSETAKAYGAKGAWLLPFTGDSSLFVDYAALSLQVVDPAGKIRRTIAAPLGPGQSLAYVSSADVDPQGNMVSRWTHASATGGGVVGGGMQAAILPNGRVGTSGSFSMASMAALPPPADPSLPPVVIRDSTMILRVNIDTKKVDTAAWLMAPPSAMVGTIGPYGPRNSIMRNLMPVSDAWAMLADGTVAAVREQDYHIDWIAPDGTLRSTPKIAHEWVELTDSAKAALIDSVRRADSTAAERQRPRLDSAAAAATRAGDPRTFMSSVGGVGVSSGGGPLDMPQYMSPDELPSYLPPFPQGDGFGAIVRADADGNLWIRATLAKPPAGGSVYDVVNRRGVLIDRVQLPGGTSIAGFGPGVVYLLSREGVGMLLARARIR